MDGGQVLDERALTAYFPNSDLRSYPSSPLSQCPLASTSSYESAESCYLDLRDACLENLGLFASACLVQRVSLLQTLVADGPPRVPCACALLSPERGSGLA